MESSETKLPAFLEEDNISQECRDLMSCLPRERGWIVDHLYRYQGFWYPPRHLQSVVSFQQHFEANDSDIILATFPKSGTTWLKALVFCLFNRPNKFQDHQPHPLLSNSPHLLVPFLELGLYVDSYIPDLSEIPSPRLFGTHVPFGSLPDSTKRSSCKLVYCCRNPKDSFVSLWHFSNKLRPKENANPSMELVFDSFLRGVCVSGPYWDHVLDYWNESQKQPEKILFLTYEEMKVNPRSQLERLAAFLGCPFTEEEEKEGMVEDIIKLCSFDNLSNLEINKDKKLPIGVDFNSFYRKGDSGGWRDTMTASMGEALDRISEKKFRGTDIKFTMKN